MGSWTGAWVEAVRARVFEEGDDAPVGEMGQLYLSGSSDTPRSATGSRGEESDAPDSGSDAGTANYTTTTYSHPPTVFSRMSSSTRSSNPPGHITPLPTLLERINAPGPIDPFHLPCEWAGVLPCEETFSRHETDAWIHHHLDHMGDKPPELSLCRFCDIWPYKAANKTKDSRHDIFWKRMQHMADHFLNEGLTADQMRLDGPMLAHMLALGKISQRQYNREVRRTTEVPPMYACPGESSSWASSSATEQNYQPSPTVEIHDQRKEDRKRKKKKQSDGSHQSRRG